MTKDKVRLRIFIQMLKCYFYRLKVVSQVINMMIHVIVSLSSGSAQSLLMCLSFGIMASLVWDGPESKLRPIYNIMLNINQIHQHKCNSSKVQRQV